MKIDYRSILQKELETRKLRNPSYNLSSFARLLKLQPSRLSEILRGKVGLSVSKASTIASILNFSDNERAHFLDLVCAEHGRSPKEKQDALARIEKIDKDYFQYDLENFQSIADWYHHAIIELISLDSTINDQGISAALGLDQEKTDQAIGRLLKLNVIEQTFNGYYKIPSNVRRIPRDIPVGAVKELNEQIITKASEELYKQHVSNRDYSIIFLSLNKDHLQLARERIKDFRRSFMKEFESAAGKDAVYCMAVQLFELTEKDYSQKMREKKSINNEMGTNPDSENVNDRALA